MKKIGPGIIFLLTQIPLICAAQETAIECTLQGLKEKIVFTPPQKTGHLPDIDFAYPVDTTIFSMREKNLLLVAMDRADKSRLRIVISAQVNPLTHEYKGQFVTDSGGNELQLDNGIVSCKSK